MISIWSVLETGDNTTLGTEVPGVGVILAVPGVGMCFVPGTRLRMLREPLDGATHQITREDRSTPPLSSSGKSAAEIRAAQPLVVDEGALSYLVLDEDAAEF